jgi:hypothetical protein
MIFIYRLLNLLWFFFFIFFNILRTLCFLVFLFFSFLFKEYFPDNKINGTMKGWCPPFLLRVLRDDARDLCFLVCAIYN